MTPAVLSANASPPRFRELRLRRHADYVLVYEGSRRHSSATLSYFYRVRPAGPEGTAVAPARFGMTTPRALGAAVLRNRIRRRLRVAALAALPLLPAGTDVVLHPRAALATLAFPTLQTELAAIFGQIARRIAAGAENTPLPRRPRGKKR